MLTDKGFGQGMGVGKKGAAFWPVDDQRQRDLKGSYLLSLFGEDT